jgi:hypothetical protein
MPEMHDCGKNRHERLEHDLRVWTHSDQERDDGSEDDGRQEVDRELVVACGNAPEVLEAKKAASILQRSR